MSLVFVADAAFRSSAGIERYARELIRALGASDLAGRTTLLTSGGEGRVARLREWAGEGPRVVALKRDPRLLRYQWSFLGAPAVERLVGGPVAVAHNPTPLRTPTERAARVVTIHDVFITKLPQLLSRRQRLVLSRQIEARAVRGSTHLIAISESTRRDLLDLFQVPESRITVVPHGLDHGVFYPRRDEAERAEVIARYGTGERFVLYVGSLYSRKLGRLLEAFAQLARRFAPDEVKLVLVGGRETAAAGEPSVDERVRTLGLGPWVVRTGRVPSADLPILMSAASAFAYVSFYEGFGFTPLEAMACGAPVVAANVSSLPEVVGDGGLLVDPDSPAEIAEALLRVLDDGDLRARLRARGAEWARRFSWERTARATFDVYRSAGAC